MTSSNDIVFWHGFYDPSEIKGAAEASAREINECGVTASAKNTMVRLLPAPVRPTMQITIGRKT